MERDGGPGRIAAGAIRTGLVMAGIAGIAVLGCGSSGARVPAVDAADETTPADGLAPEAAPDAGPDDGADALPSDVEGDVIDVDAGAEVALGQELWRRTFDNGGGYADYGHGVAVASDGSIVVVGEVQHLHAPLDFDIWVRKFDGDGSPLWTRTYDSAAPNGEADDRARAVAVDTQGGVVVAGQANLHKLWVRKYDAAGTELWTAGGDAGDGRGVVVDGAGNALVVGGGFGLRKYDATGAETMRQDLAGLDAWSVALASDGTILVAGSSPGTVADIVVRKLSAAGVELWTRSFDGGGDDRGYAVAVDGEGRVVVSGATFILRNGAPVPNLWLRQYDSTGAELWTRGGEIGTARGLAVDADGTIAVADSVGTTFLLRKYDATGRLLWAAPSSAAGLGFRQVESVAFAGARQLVAAGSVMVSNNVFAVPVDIFVSRYGP